MVFLFWKNSFSGHTVTFFFCSIACTGMVIVCSSLCFVRCCIVPHSVQHILVSLFTMELRIKFIVNWKTLSSLIAGLVMHSKCIIQKRFRAKPKLYTEKNNDSDDRWGLPNRMTWMEKLVSICSCNKNAFNICFTFNLKYFISVELFSFYFCGLLQE